MCAMISNILFTSLVTPPYFLFAVSLLTGHAMILFVLVSLSPLGFLHSFVHDWDAHFLLPFAQQFPLIVFSVFSALDQTL